MRLFQAARMAAAAASLAISTSPSLAQQSGGILRVYHRDSPASMSVLEEATLSTEMPMMPVFNNLVVYDQHVAQNSFAAIRPDLAESWNWNPDGTQLSFKLRHGVKWHDGQPFTAADVKCTWDLLQGKGSPKLRLNPRAAWYNNVIDVRAPSDDEAVFQLKRPQPALLALLASGYAPVYPCHVSPQQMRSHPIGTGPFKFVEYKPNEYIKLTKNPDYWKPGRPYLDGIEFTIIPNRSTAVLAFVSGKFDLTWPWDVPITLVNDIKSQAPAAQCQIASMNASRNLDITRDRPPFDNPDIRQAMALALDRKAFRDILDDGGGGIGGAMLPRPDGVWGMPPAMLATLPGYGPDIAKNRSDARALMAKAGYTADNPLKVKVSARNIPVARDPAVILIDQLKTINIAAELDLVDTAVWFPRATRHDFAVALGLGASGVDDPDQQFYQNYACGSPLNITGYCNHEIEALFDRQSMEPDQEKRRPMVWDIDRRLQLDNARPIIFYNDAATCWQPTVKGLTIMVNSIYNGWRMEDVWLQK
ncbi:MAG TPA: ABC transporter substrate-binding protein [Stellaceae bacterium]|jgi:peptide/nickel transport system substrate-binding protein|nr:ABC transporter substrate-binding protein [Stellaceae bacterium]